MAWQMRRTVPANKFNSTADIDRYIVGNENSGAACQYYALLRQIVGVYRAIGRRLTPFNERECLLRREKAVDEPRFDFAVAHAQVAGLIRFSVQDALVNLSARERCG
jgi:hypothetical protein